jgi:hypothetical protein
VFALEEEREYRAILPVDQTSNLEIVGDEDVVRLEVRVSKDGTGESIVAIRYKIWYNLQELLQTRKIFN